MVTVLGAQLGNQMFQYAAARALANARGSDLLLYLPPDVDGSSLSGFGLSARPWNNEDRIARPYQALLLSSSPLGRIARRAERLRPITTRRWYENHGFNHDPRFERLPGSVVLSGYWQSYKYFHHMRETLRTEFRQAAPFSAAAQSAEAMIAETPESVGIHVRRGEYVQQGWPLLGSDYFEKALRILATSCNVSSPRPFVFSNDPAWCATELLPGRPKTIVSGLGTTPREDLALMSRCRYLLISPSTFSWWAAYLSRTAKAVLAPFRWFFHDYAGFRHEDIYLPDWIVVHD